MDFCGVSSEICSKIDVSRSKFNKVTCTLKKCMSLGITSEPLVHFFYETCTIFSLRDKKKTLDLELGRSKFKVTSISRICFVTKLLKTYVHFHEI